MLIPIDDIKERVCALLDENPDIIREQTEYGDPEYSILQLVEIYLEDAAKIVAASAPLAEIAECSVLGTGLDSPGGKVYGAVTVKMSEECVRMELPSDFLRLAWIRMSDWNHSVSEPLAFGGDEYRLRQGGLRRSRRRCPAVAVHQVGPLKRMEIYGSRPGERVVEFGWITVPCRVGDNLELPHGLFSRLCRQVADMVKLNLQRE